MRDPDARAGAHHRLERGDQAARRVEHLDRRRSPSSCMYGSRLARITMRSPCRNWRSVARRRAGLHDAGDALALLRQPLGQRAHVAHQRLERALGVAPTAPGASPRSSRSTRSAPRSRVISAAPQREDEERRAAGSCGWSPRARRGSAGRAPAPPSRPAARCSDRGDGHVDPARGQLRRHRPRLRARRLGAHPGEQGPAGELGGVGVGRGQQLAARRAGRRAHDALVAGDVG